MGHGDLEVQVFGLALGAEELGDFFEELREGEEGFGDGEEV